MNLDKYGTGDESTLARKRPNGLEFIDLDEKIENMGLERSKL